MEARIAPDRMVAASPDLRPCACRLKGREDGVADQAVEQPHILTQAPPADS
jgi:hypothetical protein